LRDHLKILGILHVVWGGFGLVGGLAALLVMGGLAALIGVAGRGEEGAAVAVPLLALMGLLVCGLVAVLSLPHVISGFGLLKRRGWARVLGIVLSALDLLNVPFGTALGIYGLWVLVQPESSELLSSHRGS
jgi:hypothetical protein